MLIFAGYLPRDCGGTTTVPDRGELLLIQFARVPRVGKVKTRLIPALGEEGACELHGQLMRHCCRQLVQARLGPLELWLDTPVSGHEVVMACVQQGASVRQQQGKDLGERMYHALQDGLARYRSVILVGSDCPEIDRAYLLRAQQALATHPVTFGPAVDGGYVLIGARQIHRAVFSGIEWGTSSVLTDSLANLARLGWEVGLLSPLADIDRPEDLTLWSERVER